MQEEMKRFFAETLDAYYEGRISIAEFNLTALQIINGVNIHQINLDIAEAEKRMQQ